MLFERIYNKTFERFSKVEKLCYLIFFQKIKPKINIKIKKKKRKRKRKKNAKKKKKPKNEMKKTLRGAFNGRAQSPKRDQGYAELCTLRVTHQQPAAPFSADRAKAHIQWRQGARRRRTRTTAAGRSSKGTSPLSSASMAAPAPGGEPQKQLLSIIRDFAAEKSHGGKRPPFPHHDHARRRRRVGFARARPRLTQPRLRFWGSQSARCRA